MQLAKKVRQTHLIGFAKAACGIRREVCRRAERAIGRIEIDQRCIIYPVGNLTLVAREQMRALQNLRHRA